MAVTSIYIYIILYYVYRFLEQIHFIGCSCSFIAVSWIPALSVLVRDLGLELEEMLCTQRKQKNKTVRWDKSGSQVTKRHELARRAGNLAK